MNQENKQWCDNPFSQDYKSYKIIEIIKAVSIVTGVSIIDMQSYRKPHRTMMARRLACYCIREFTTASFTQIGRSLVKDHTTVLHACSMAQESINNGDEILLKQIESVKAVLLYGRKKYDEASKSSDVSDGEVDEPKPKPKPEVRRPVFTGRHEDALAHAAQYGRICNAA
jgi:hypothetical protein